MRAAGRGDGDGYPEFARERFELVVHGAAPDDRPARRRGVPGADGRFDVPNAGTGFVVEFTA